MKPFLVTSSVEPSARLAELSVDFLTKAAEIRLRLHHRLSFHFRKAETGGAGTAAGVIDGDTKPRASSLSNHSSIFIGVTGFQKIETGGAGTVTGGVTTGRENSGRKNLSRQSTDLPQWWKDLSYASTGLLLQWRDPSCE